MSEEKQYCSICRSKVYPETWTIGISGKDRYHIHRWVDGVINESYRPATQEEAAVWVVAVVMGRVPPTGLRHLDTPLVQTQAVRDRRRAVSAANIQGQKKTSGERGSSFVARLLNRLRLFRA